MKKLLPLLVLPLLGACAPTMSKAAAPINVSVNYTSGTVAASADNPVLVAVVAAATSAPTLPGRQAWRAEDVDRNSVVLRSNATSANTGNFNSFIGSLPQEMKFTFVSSGSTTIVNASYSSEYAAAAQYIFAQLDKRFRRVK